MSRLKLPSVAPSEITPEPVWRSRREWLRAAGLTGAALAAPGLLKAAEAVKATDDGEALTSKKDVTHYNNFYEFGTGKGDPAAYAGALKTQPWAVAVEGEVERPAVFDLDKLRGLAALEERIYRLRCVEAWSMVIPWQGYPLSVLLGQVRPTSRAKYVSFETALQPENMPGLRAGILDWPYLEGLRIDEAMHPLTLLTFGVYGEPLPPQNGAPVRVIIPWKYGFKSGKSIVRIRLSEAQPTSSWMRAAPSEYGFYANVNPDVPHPRWSQATERRIGSGLFARRIDTLKFNGYGEQVASLYAGMDLTRNF